MSDVTTATNRYAGSSVQKAALVVGIVFLLVGIAGFVPGITTGDLAGAGHESMGMLLGIFQVSVLHNIVHLLFGVAGVLMARSVPAARSYLIGGGIVYLLLFVYGLIVDSASAANFVPLNGADDILHLVLGLGMLSLGLLLGRDQDDRGVGGGYDAVR